MFTLSSAIFTFVSIASRRISPCLAVNNMAALATDRWAGRSRVGIHPNKEICCSKKYIANSIEAQKVDIEIFFFKIFQKKKCRDGGEK